MDIHIKEINPIGTVKVLMLKGEQGEAGVPTQEMTTIAVAEWLDDHPEATTTVQDGSITEAKLDSALADKVNAGGMTNDAKNALIALLEKVVYVDENGQDYLNALESALFPPVSISCVFNQGQTVIYNTDSLDTLRQYLTVTALYEDSTTEVVTTYDLSGRLTVGTSTITVSFGGKTDTFNVTVTKQPNGLVDGTYTVSGGTITVSNNVLSFDSGIVNYKNFSIPFMHPIELYAGDVVTFSAKDASTTSLNINVPTAFNTDAYYSGNYNPYQTTVRNRTKTMASDMSATSLKIQTLGSMKNTNFTFVLLVNGEEVFS